MCSSGKRSINGIIRELADLPDNTIITREALGEIFNRCSTTVKRNEKSGKLPPSVDLFGESVWTIGDIITHLKERLQIAKREKEKDLRRFHKHKP